VQPLTEEEVRRLAASNVCMKKIWISAPRVVFAQRDLNMDTTISVVGANAEMKRMPQDVGALGGVTVLGETPHSKLRMEVQVM
jgi:hypothetical protein